MFRRTLLICVLLLPVLLLHMGCGQAPAGVPAGSVLFIVSNSTNGEKVSGATISINSTSADTNIAGEAAFSLPDGRYDFTAAKAGFQNYQSNLSVASNTSQTVPVTLTPEAYSPIPSGLTAAPLDGSRIALSWDALTATGLAGYNLYRSTASGGPFTKINSALITTATFEDSGLTPSTTYYYKLTAVNDLGGESGFSAAASAATGAIYFILSWGELSTGSVPADGKFKDPIGAAIDGDGNVYITDSNNCRVQKFDSSGNFIGKWGAKGTGDGEFMFPRGIAVDGSGSVYVADTQNDRIQKFDRTGSYITQFGSRGSGNGQFKEPAGIAVDGSNLFVTDSSNHRVQKFDSQGGFLAKWGEMGAEDGQLKFPEGIAVGPDGNIHVVDSGNDRVQIFTGSGAFLSRWGSEGTGDGQFQSPTGVAIDSSGSVYVADYMNHRIQKFYNGALLNKWGDFGPLAGQFNKPYSIALNSSGQIYIVDSGNHRVQKFGQ